MPSSQRWPPPTRLCDHDPRITATDLVLAMWEQLAVDAQAHLMLRFTRAATGTLTDLSTAWDQAGENAHRLHQATPAGVGPTDFAGTRPGDLPSQDQPPRRLQQRQPGQGPAQPVCLPGLSPPYRAPWPRRCLGLGGWRVGGVVRVPPGR